MQALHQKVDLSQYGVGSSGKSTQRAGSSSQPGATDKLTGSRNSPAVRNLPIKVTSQGASSSDIPPQGRSSPSKPMKGSDFPMVNRKMILKYQPKGKRNSGRPLKRWKDSVL
jgi:hypothetical protein